MDAEDIREELLQVKKVIKTCFDKNIKTMKHKQISELIKLVLKTF